MALLYWHSFLAVVFGEEASNLIIANLQSGCPVCFREVIGVEGRGAGGKIFDQNTIMLC